MTTPRIDPPQQINGLWVVTVKWPRGWQNGGMVSTFDAERMETALNKARTDIITRHTAFITAQIGKLTRTAKLHASNKHRFQTANMDA